MGLQRVGHAFPTERLFPVICLLRPHLPTAAFSCERDEPRCVVGKDAFLGSEAACSSWVSPANPPLLPDTLPHPCPPSPDVPRACSLAVGGGGVGRGSASPATPALGWALTRHARACPVPGPPKLEVTLSAAIWAHLFSSSLRAVHGHSGMSDAL